MENICSPLWCGASGIEDMKYVDGPFRYKEEWYRSAGLLLVGDRSCLPFFPTGLRWLIPGVRNWLISYGTGMDGKQAEGEKTCCWVLLSIF